MAIDIQRADEQGADVLVIGTADAQLVTGACVLMGMVLTDEATGAVKVHLHNGTADTAPHVLAVAAASGGQDTIWYGPNGVSCPGGIYMDVVTGTPSGSIFYHVA